jgi:hypothetical protein
MHLINFDGTSTSIAYRFRLTQLFTSPVTGG